MRLKCIAIDDEPLALKQVCNYIDKTPFLELCTSCKNAEEGLDAYAQHQPDILFVDINMPGINGMEFVRSLHESNSMIIFTTAYPEYAVEGFKVNALDYLLKPISYVDFLKAANKAKNLYDLKSNANNTTNESKVDKGFLFVKSEYKYLRLNLDTITHIEGLREYVRIHLTNSKPAVSLLSMKTLEEQLPPSRFMRVHKSFIINLEKIVSIERNHILLEKDFSITVGEQYKEAFQKYVEQHFI